MYVCMYVCMYSTVHTTRYSGLPTKELVGCVLQHFSPDALLQLMSDKARLRRLVLQEARK